MTQQTGRTYAPFCRAIARALAIALFLLAATAGFAQDATAPAEPAAQSQTERLLDILRDDAARTALIAELERASPDTLSQAEPAAEEQIAEVSFGRRLALLTESAAENGADWLQRTWRGLARSPQMFTSLGQEELGVLVEALRELLVVIAITVAVFVILRRLMVPIFRRMGDRASDSAFVRTVLLFSGSVGFDILIVMMTWGIGYAIAILALGDFGDIGIRQTLYLNAFLIVELIKVAFRAVLAPSSAGLRPVPLTDEAARGLYRSSNLVISLLGYGQLLVVPVINANASFLAGRAASALILLVALIYLVLLVIRKRRPVSAWLMGLVAPPGPVPMPGEDGAPPAMAAPRRRPSPGLQTLAQSWHWLAFAYLGTMLLIVLTRPADALYAAVFASVQIALALVVASVISSAISRAIAHGVTLPAHVTSRLPLLERRLNGLVPAALIAARLAIVAALTLFALDVLGLVPVAEWIRSEAGLQVSGATASVLLILAINLAVFLALTSWVDYRLNPDFGKVPTAREQTLLTLLRNAATIVLAVLTLMICLSEIGLNIGPLLASAGVLGLAIGFGAQKMVQDIITGVFIQFENAVNVGDVITVAGTTGVVEKLTVRSVSLRDLNGVFHIIPFSSVDMVSNFTRDYGFFVADMGVAYREDTTEAKQAMFDAFDELMADPEQSPHVLGAFEWFGLNSFGASEVVLRARIKTLPGKQWGVGRAYNEIVKRTFDERGIEIPFPHQTVFFGERKDGTTQTLHVADDSAPST
ncbi:mechanosensitive ion channel domain-containing protein [Roseisalinus antarcticus]|nr:mechanosensitive ion channel domain-containing protein [Roseisalinus antarcticus]